MEDAAIITEMSERYYNKVGAVNQRKLHTAYTKGTPRNRLQGIHLSSEAACFPTVLVPRWTARRSLKSSDWVQTY